MDELIPGYDALGIEVAVGDDQRLEKLLKSLWAVSPHYPCEEGECGAFSGEYFRVWTRLSSQGIDQVLESNPMPGMVAHIESFEGTDRAKLWVWDRQDLEAKEPIFPLCARTPMSWFPGHADRLNFRTPVAISVLARDAEFFDDEAALKAHPDLGRLASESVIPTGLFDQGKQGGEAAEEMIASALVVGHVLLAVRSLNEFAIGHFYALRVRTLGGECWVNLPDSAVVGDVTGKIVAVQGMVSATFPELLPQPLPEEESADPMGELKSADVEAKLRSRCIDFFSDPEASDSFLEDIHFTRAAAKFAAGMGVFVKDARGVAKNRGILDDALKRRYKEAAQHAPIVFAHIVMANTMVLYSGENSPALVVVAFGEGANEAMGEARSVLARIHFGTPENDNERALAKTIEDEDYHFGNRRRLPQWLVGNVEAYAADLWIPAAAAYEDGLLCEVLPCLAEPGEDGLTSAIPTNLILLSLGRPPIVPKQPVVAETPPVPAPPRTFIGGLKYYVKLLGIAFGVMCAVAIISLGSSFFSSFFDKDEEMVAGNPELSMSAFWRAHHRIDSTEKERALGSRRANREVSALFIKSMKANKAELLEHVGESFKEKALERLGVYTQRANDSIALLVHVPELRNYKDQAVREALAASAWKAANEAIAERLPKTAADTILIIGLRGTSDYGPIWSGKVGSDPDEKTDGDSMGERLHSYFTDR